MLKKTPYVRHRIDNTKATDFKSGFISEFEIIENINTGPKMNKKDLYIFPPPY